MFSVGKAISTPNIFTNNKKRLPTQPAAASLLKSPRQYVPGRKPEGEHTAATAAAVSYRTGRGKSKRLERRAAKTRGHTQRAGMPKKKKKRKEKWGRQNKIKVPSCSFGLVLSR